MRRFIAPFLFLLILAGSANATARLYTIDHQKSRLDFKYTFVGDVIRGSFPDFAANLLLDFKNFKNSDVEIAINTATAKGGFVFATTALRGPKILHAKKFPTINFKSKSVALTKTGAELAGQITIRGITRPITLVIQFMQLQGNSPADRDNLAMRITGQLNRHDFGASGYADMVADTLGIDVFAYIQRQP